MNAIIKNEMTQYPNNFQTTWKKIGAIGGLLFGLILLVAGVVLSAIAFLEKVNFNNTEVIMIVTSFVFLGLGAHCLDLLDKERKAQRG